MKKIFFITSLLALIIIAGLYAEKKFHHSLFQTKIAKKEVNELVKNNDV